MNHRRIEEMNIPDLYATGRLSAEDEEVFETHLLECRECREQVAWADDFGSSMRSVAVEEAARVSVHAGFLVWLSRRPAFRMALTAALLVLAALPAWLIVERSSLRTELAQARAAAERPAPPAPTIPAATQPAPAVPQGPAPATQAELEQLKQERSRLAAELGQEREARRALAGRVTELTRPQVPALYSLGVVRGASDAGEIELGPRPEWVVLSLELPAAEDRIYRATLYDAQDRKVSEWDGLIPTGNDVINVQLYSDLLKPGTYRVHLEGMDGGGSGASLDIPFQVRNQG